MARPTRTPVSRNGVVTASAAVYHPTRNPVKRKVNTERNAIAKPWQVEVYRHVNICGEARYAATLFAHMAGRAEIGVSEAQTLSSKATWVTSGPEVEAFAELAPTVRERTKLIRDYMLHRTLAGECYLIARDRQENDPEYEDKKHVPVWEIVAVTELQKIGNGDSSAWRVRYDNNEYIDLNPSDPIIRLWTPDPEDRREAWSPFRSLLPTLREIEWLTKHIFTQVRSRLMSAGVWFLPDNLTFPPPPTDAVEGGADAIASMNEAEQFMLSLAASSMEILDGDEVSFPSVVMAEAAALATIDQNKLIKFWSEIDDKAMTLRSDAVRRFALGMDLPPEQVLGSSGLAVTGAGGSAGSVNHWGVWANEEQTISAHIEPALDDLVAVLTSAFLRAAVEGTDKVIGYDTATLRLRQDRSKEALEWFDRGVLKAEVALRETGFDPATDMMTEDEHRVWVLNKIVSGSATPEQLQAAFLLLTGEKLPVEPPAQRGTPVEPGDVRDGDGDGFIDEAGPSKRGQSAPQLPGDGAPSLDDHPYEGPPRVDHEHNDAPYTALAAASEVLVLRALEKAGNRLLNDGKRGRDKDRTTPAHLAHIALSSETLPEFDFTLLPTVLSDLPAMKQALVGRALNRYCTDLYRNNLPYTREGLIEAVSGL